MRRRLPLALAVVLASGCVGDVGERQQQQRNALFVGIDVSGSFYHSKYYDDALEFLSNYLYAHISGKDKLSMPKELFVGSIGGNFSNETKAFHPIYDFQNKTPEQIKADLKAWFPKSENISDFNVFFREVANIARKRNLSLMPITAMMLTDGIPALPGPGDRADIGRFGKIDLSPLEYVSRNVTVRVLYADPTVSDKWETAILRRRVKVWTVDATVMSGWKAQLQADAGPDQQPKFWKWVQDIVDYRVMAVKLAPMQAKPRR